MAERLWCQANNIHKRKLETKVYLTGNSGLKYPFVILTFICWYFTLFASQLYGFLYLSCPPSLLMFYLLYFLAPLDTFPLCRVISSQIHYRLLSVWVVVIDTNNYLRVLGTQFLFIFVQMIYFAFVLAQIISICLLSQLSRQVHHTHKNNKMLPWRTPLLLS